MLPMPAGDAARRKLTYEDYCAIPADGQRHEILGGVHVVSPSPLDRHQRVCLNLSYLLEDFLRRTRIGALREAPSDVRLGPHDVVQPDHYVILADHFGRLERRGCQGAPDLVVEVLSRSRPELDLVDKLRLYETAGVLEYWVVDPDLDRVEVYRREAAPDMGEGATRFARPLLLLASRGDSIDTPLLPGFSSRLSEVFDPGPEGRVEEPRDA